MHSIQDISQQIIIKMARRKFRIHKPTSLLSRDNSKQRGVGRPKKKEHWREKRRREDKEEQEKLKHHCGLAEVVAPDCAYDNPTERECQGLMPSTDAESTNDDWGGDDNDWGGESTDWGGESTEETIEIFVENTPQTQPLPLV